MNGVAAPSERHSCGASHTFENNSHYHLIATRKRLVLTLVGIGNPLIGMTFRRHLGECALTVTALLDAEKGGKGVERRPTQDVFSASALRRGSQTLGGLLLSLLRPQCAVGRIGGHQAGMSSLVNNLPVGHEIDFIGREQSRVSVGYE